MENSNKINNRLYGIRGAICTQDSVEDIVKNTSLLYSTILEKNNISESDIVSIQFTSTPDLTKLNPAAALRRAGFASDVPLFCSLEPVFENSLKNVIRCLILAYSQEKGKSVYLNGAEVLRPDLTR